MSNSILNEHAETLNNQPAKEPDAPKPKRQRKPKVSGDPVIANFIGFDAIGAQTSSLTPPQLPTMETPAAADFAGAAEPATAKILDPATQRKIAAVIRHLTDTYWRVATAAHKGFVVASILDWPDAEGCDCIEDCDSIVHSVHIWTPTDLAIWYGRAMKHMAKTACDPEEAFERTRPASRLGE